MAKSILEDRTVSKRFLFAREKHFSNPFIVNGQGVRLSCYKQERFTRGKMLLVFHASNEIVGDYTESFAHEVDKMGINLFIAEYPGFSMSTGTPSLINILGLVPEIIKKCGTPLKDLVVFGRSIGAAYAIEAVTQHPEIKGLIIESGMANFYERFERRVSAEDIDVTEEVLKKEVLKYFNHQEKLKKYKGATLIMHTKEDRIINVKHAKMNYEWANEPKELKLFDNGDHSDIQFSNKRAYFDTIREFVERL